jgi:hypothetical protein
MTTPTLGKFDGAVLYDLLDERAALLDAALTDGRYEEWFERKLARELIAGLSAGQRRGALEILVIDKMHGTIAMGGLLSEEDQASYDIGETAARMVLTEITVQDREALTLEVLMRDEICERQRLIAFNRQEMR